MKLSNKMLIAATASFAMLAPLTAYADWFFRGTPNSWGSTELEFVSGSSYKTCQSFGSSDPRFKIDRFGDWSENYPQSDRIVNANTSYDIEFDSSSHAITTTEVSSCGGEPGPAQNFNSLFLRGTPNSWGTTELSLVSDNTWQVTVEFDGQSEQRFKFDVSGDWSQDYGDSNNDGVLEQGGGDINTSISGSYLVEVNDDSLAYSITLEDGGNQSPTASISPSSANITVGDSVTFSASGSNDPEGGNLNYLWSDGSTAESTTITFSTVGNQSVTVTVTDDGDASDQATATVQVADDTQTPESNFASLFLRGTPNSWGTSAMTLVADNTWRVTINFDGQSDQRYKFDVGGDWSQNYGDSNNDGTLEQSGGDISTSISGNHIVEVNDQTLAYSVTPEGGDTAPTAVINPGNDQTVNLGDTIQFDASGSSDAEGNIASYSWSTGESSETISITFSDVGTQTVTVTVTDQGGQTASDSVTITVQDNTSSDNWFFRGTPNSWGTSSMTTSDNINYCTQQSFGNNDPRFKIDHLGDWTESYPSEDFRVDSGSTYDVCINSGDKNVTAVKVQGADTQAPWVSASPSAGSYTTNQSVTLSVTDNEDQSPQIFYTTDGSTPSTSSTLYNGESLNANEVGAGADLVIKTLAVDVSNNHAEQSFSYFIGEQSSGSGDFREETIYFLLTARFYDGDESNNYYNRDRIKQGDPHWRGDFKGLIQQLDYIKDMGFTAVWVTPPVENRSGLDYHGYHAYDWTKVDPRLESSDATYQDFINAAHDKGLKVIQDVVINHSSQYGIRDKVWIDHLPIKYYVPQGSSQGQISNDPYFGNLGDYQAANRDDNDNSVAPQWFKDRHTSDPDGTTPLVDPNTGTAVPLAGYDPNRFFGVDAQNLDENWYHPDGFMAGGDWENPGSLQRKHLAGDTMDLFTEKQNVRDYLNDAMKMYLDMGVDAIRLDTAKHLERGDLLSYTQDWQAHKPGLFVFGEALVLGVGFGSENGNDNGPAEIRPWWYTRTGSSATNPTGDSGFSVLDFPLFSTFRDNVTQGNFSQVGGVLSMDHFYADPTQLVTFFQNHDLGPDNDFKFRYGGAESNAALAYNLLWTIRGIPTLYYGEEVQFMAGAPQDIKEADDTVDMTGRAYFGPTLDDPSTNQHNLYKHIKRLNQIRLAIPALQKGPMASVNEWGAGMSFVREFESSYVVVGLAGNSGQNVSVFWALKMEPIEMPSQAIISTSITVR